MINGGLINGVQINGALTGDTPTGTPTTISRAIEITLAAQITITRAIIINAAVPVTLTRAIEINAHAFNTLPGNAINWNVTVLIDGVDYSARLTGTINIARAVNAATLADVALVPVAGAITPTAFDGKTIEIRYQDARGHALLFKGRVIRPVINMADKVLRLTCSDLLQETVGKLSTDQIDAIIPNQRSSAIYKETEDNYDYAQECLRSAEGDIFLGIDNEVLYQSWTESNPVAFGNDGILYGSIVPTFADRHSLVNTVKINFDYRHFVGWHRVHELAWGIPLTYFGWLSQHFSTLPTVEMIKTAIPSSCVLAVQNFEEPPPSGIYGEFSIISGVTIVYLNGFPPGHTAYGFNIEAAERWLQTVTRKLTLTVSAPASVAQYGEIASAVKYALSNVEDTIDFANINDDRLFGTNAGFNNAGPVVVSDKLPPVEFDQSFRDWRVWTYRKKLFGKNGTEAIATGAIACVLREAAKTILASHQNGSIDFETPIQPLLTLKNNVSINAEGVTATGRIKQIEHILDSETGSVTTKIKCVPVSGSVNQTLTVPPLLDNPPIVTAATAPALLTYLGGAVPYYDYDEPSNGWIPDPDSPESIADNEDWRGYIGNHAGQSDYQERFVVEIPEIQNDLRDEQTIEQSAALTINVILDKIGLTV